MLDSPSPADLQRVASDGSLRSATVQLAAVCHTIPGGVLLEDRHRKVVLANQRFCDLFGVPVPPDALVGGDCAEYAAQAKALFVDPEGFVERVLALVGARAPGLGDELLLADGRVFRRDYVPLSDGGEFTGHLWHYEDLSAQRAAERAALRRARLQELARRVMASLFEERGVGFGVDLLLGEAGTLLGLSTACVVRHVSAQSGLVEPVEWRPGAPLRRGSVVALPWLEGISPMATGLVLRAGEATDDAERDGLLAALAAEGCGSAFVAMLMVFARPEAVFLFAHAEPRNPFPEEECILLQSTIDGLGRALERRVLERERRGHAQELSGALQRAEAASRLKSQFVAYLSHEIRNPIGAIEGYAALLEQPRVTEARNLEVAGHLRRNAEHLLVLANDILDLSRVELGQLEVRRGPQRLRELVEEVLSVMQSRAAAKGLSLTVRWPPLIPEPFETDATRFKQILLNLVGNSIKFTEQGGVEVRVEVDTPTGGRNAALVLSVVDTGLGIPADRLATLFQPFRQAHDDSAQRGGAGLGLAISRALVRILGGELSVSSGVGVGTTMTAHFDLGPAAQLHLRPSQASAPNAGRSARRPAPVISPLLRGKRVLSVDDSADNLRIARFLLERAGMVVEEARNGAECIEAVLAAVSAGAPFDAVLLDMGMPEVDGYEAAQRLRAAGVRTPILALTAHVFPEEKVRCLVAGCDVYLPKPVDAGKLYEALALQLGLAAQELQDLHGIQESQESLGSLESQGVQDSQGAEESQGADESRDAPVDTPAAATQAAGAPSAGPEPAAGVDDGWAVQSSLFGDPAFAPLLTRYLGNLPRRIDEVASSVARGDLASLRTLCHQIKGSAASYGFPSISEAAGVCEQHLRDGADLAGVSGSVAALLRRMRAALPG